MKILTVTSQTANNYGAVLQAYALQQTLLRLGYENELLNHTREHKGERKVSIKARMRNAVISLYNCIHYGQTKAFNKGFELFRKNHFITTKLYDSVSQIQKDPPKSDCYLTGSDQVFALGTPLASLRFLNFGHLDIPRVSYAASLGSYEPNPEDIDELKQSLKKFRRISVRELQGASFIEKHVGYQCQTHIDPVFLLNVDEWDKISKPPKSEGEYILCFPMLGNPNTSIILKKLKQETNLKIISLQNKSVKTVKADKYIFGASPEEFIGYIKNAKAVVTTSFHATAFSILYEKPFYSLVGNYKPERAYNLCRLMGLENRVIAPNDTDIPNINGIDFSYANDIIKREQESAFAYLSELEDLVSETHYERPNK
jgi:hypothetical protein